MTCRPPSVASGCITGHPDVNDDQLPDDVRGFYHALEQGVPMPADPRMNQVRGPLEYAIINILTNDAAITDEFGEAAASIRSA